MSTIREFIGQDLRSRISTGSGPPLDLSLQALSRHYGVSLTPVREAVRDLVADGVLRKSENGRLGIGSKKSTVETTPLPPADPTNFEDDLAAEMIARSLRGETDYLREEATAERFGVGRTVIRQAFATLVGRGLIIHVPRCGWKVRAFDEEDLNAFLEVRETLELQALDLAGPHLVRDDLLRMLEGNHADATNPRLDNDLHDYFIEKSKNPYIRDFFDRHGTYYASLFNFAAPETHEVVQMAIQHRQILQALLDHDWNCARRVLIEHIRAQRSIVRELMGRLGRPAMHPTSEDPAR